MFGRKKRTHSDSARDDARYFVIYSAESSTADLQNAPSDNYVSNLKELLDATSQQHRQSDS